MSSLIFVLVYLGGRLFFFPIDKILSGEKRLISIKITFGRISFGILFFIFFESLALALIVFLLLILAILVDIYLYPSNARWNPFLYWLQLFLGLVFIPLIIHILQPVFTFWDNYLYHLFLLACSSQFTVEIETTSRAKHFLLIVVGYLFILKEATIIIRLQLNKIKATPKQSEEPDQPDLVEYERGRLIGILERTFYYFSVIFNQIPVLAIIIALKSLARFKELDNKDFAEYFLIGSLLSLLSSLVPAVLVRIFLSI